MPEGILSFNEIRGSAEVDLKFVADEKCVFVAIFVGFGGEAES
jgi:hypothetical protein